MNFDVGEVLSQAWQITWKHKILWVITALPASIIFLALPFMFAPILLDGQDPRDLSNLFGNPIFVPVIIVIYMVILVVGMLLQIVSRSSVTLGILRAEEGIQPITFMKLLSDGLPYFWRILGVFALTNVTVGFAFFVFFICVMVLTVVTIGMASICLQPLFLLISPLSLLVLAFMEQAEAAVVVDGMDVMGAVKRGYELVRANIWKYALITIVIYFGMSILISVLIFPFMIPFFVFALSDVNSETNFRNVMWMVIGFSALFTPILVLVQGIAMTFLKSSLMITYLRLTRGLAAQPVLLEAVSP
jgi:hypothetical protein